MMNMAEAAAAAGLSQDTIRFYERQGVIPPLDRDAGGRRCFSPQDVARLSFLAKLRGTGMPLAEMKAYADLVQAGAATTAQRRHLLERHAQRLRDDMAARAAALVVIEDKIAAYAESENGQAAPLCCLTAINAVRASR